MSVNNYDIVIGLEIHAELNTKTKAFCGCANIFGSEPNTNCCPVCVGMPGALPILNREAIKKTIKAGLALGCSINDVTIFEKKNYFYPDLPKAYQISQLVKPICLGGGIKLKNGKFARLNRIHLEEDAGKLTHNNITKETMVDYNRGGVPLIEIVTEPDFSTADEVVEFLKEVRSRLTFADIAECKMEEGGMRCDVNLSLKPKGSVTLGNRTETKNLNSFKMVARAIEFESSRQAQILDEGGKVILETRKWNDAVGKTNSMRTKEESQDYRYFPDSDIHAIEILKDEVEKIRAEMPILAYQIKERLINKFGLPEYDAEILTRTKEISNYFLNCVEFYNNPKVISNWIMVDLLKLKNEKDEFPISEKKLTDIIKMVDERMINKALGLQLLSEVIETDKDPNKLAKERGMIVTISEEEILNVLIKLKENQQLVEDYQNDKQKVGRFIIGQVMRATQGKAKGDIVEQLLQKVFD